MNKFWIPAAALLLVGTLAACSHDKGMMMDDDMSGGMKGEMSGGMMDDSMSGGTAGEMTDGMGEATMMDDGMSGGMDKKDSMGGM